MRVYNIIIIKWLFQIMAELKCLFAMQERRKYDVPQI